jgi:hypothetical protein
MKTYSQYVRNLNEATAAEIKAKYGKPVKQNIRSKAKDGRYVSVWIEGPDRKESGKFWFVPSMDGNMVDVVLRFATDMWGIAPWVVYKFRVETDRSGDGVRFIRHREAVEKGYSHWSKFDPSPNATF